MFGVSYMVNVLNFQINKFDVKDVYIYFKYEFIVI